MEVFISVQKVLLNAMHHQRKRAMKYRRNTVSMTKTALV